MSKVVRAIAELDSQGLIHVIRYRKNRRTGLDIPVYSVSVKGMEEMDVHHLLAGVTSERLVEYDFVRRNLPDRTKKETIIDIGSSESGLSGTMREHSGRWKVIGIGIAPEGCDARMDARALGLRDGSIDRVVCVSTIEHVGSSSGIVDGSGDIKAIGEMFRVLRKSGTAIITAPYGLRPERDHRIYNKSTLDRIIGRFSRSKMEFYRFDSGKWRKCSRMAAENNDAPVPPHFHSSACVCLLLTKQ